MHPKTPTLSQHRLQRFHRWAMLWLRWFVGFLDGASAFAPLSRQAQAIGHAWLDRIEVFVTNIVILGAMPNVRLPKAPRHAQQRRNDSQVRRAVIGSAPRRTLRAKGLRQRIAALSQDLKTLVVRLAKRLSRGLTRRRPILARREWRVIPCVSSECDRLCVADTS